MPQTLVRKQKRPLLRESPTPTIPPSFDSPLPQMSDTEWVRRGSGLVWNPPRNPFYAHLRRVAFEPTWYHQGEDVHGFPPYDPSTGGHGRYDYGGRQYRAPHPNLPSSPYQFKDVSEYPKPAERHIATPTRKRRSFKSCPDYKEELSHSTQSNANISEVRGPKHADPRRSSNSNTMLDTNSTSFRFLKRALPQVTEDQTPKTSQAEDHRPSERKMTLPLRPARSTDSLRSRETRGLQTPHPVSKRQRTARSTQ